MQRAFLRAALLTVAAIAAAAEARTRDEQVTAPIAYADLNLATAAGRTELDRRIRHAAYEMCRRTYAGPGHPTDLPEPRCLAEAHASASTQVEAAIARARLDQNVQTAASR